MGLIKSVKVWHFWAISIGWEIIELFTPYEWARESWLNKLFDVGFNFSGFYVVRRYVENLSGQTVSWKDSLQNKIDNLYQIYKGFEILQQEFEADLLRLHTKDQEKSKQMLEITHDIVEHEVDISLNRQNIGLVGDTINPVSYTHLRAHET